MTIDDVTAHYERRWGSPTRRARFDVADVTMTILKWAANANSEGVALYATAGASSYVFDEDKPEHRVEFFLGLLPEQDDAAKPLAMLATYPKRTGRPLNHGDTVSFQEPLWTGTTMQGFLVAAPQHKFLEPLALQGGLHVEFLQAIPTYESEVQLKREVGAAGLLDRWEASGVRFWDPGRASLHV